MAHLPFEWRSRAVRFLAQEQQRALKHATAELNSVTYAVLGAQWYVDMRARVITLWKNPDGKPWVYLPVPSLELAVPLPSMQGHGHV